MYLYKQQMESSTNSNLPTTRCLQSSLSKNKIQLDRRNKAFLLLTIAAVSLSVLDYHLVDINTDTRSHKVVKGKEAENKKKNNNDFTLHSSPYMNILRSHGGRNDTNANGSSTSLIIRKDKKNESEPELELMGLNESNETESEKNAVVTNKVSIAPSSAPSSAPTLSSSSSYCPVKFGSKIRVIPSNIAPYLDGHRSWSKYLHFLIYKKGVPAQVNAINFCDQQGNVYAYQNYRYDPPDISTWERNSTLWTRSGRFPSIDERIAYYMGSQWSSDNDNDNNQNLFFNNPQFNISAIRCRDILNTNDTHVSATYCLSHDIPNSTSSTLMYNFIKGKLVNNTLIEGNVVPYTRDIIDMAIIHKQLNSTAPIFIHFGDGVSVVTRALNYSFPVFGKVRDLNAEKNKVNHTRYGFQGCKKCIPVHSNIIWPLNRMRHFKYASYVPLNDIPFHNKTGVLMWRGRLERQSKSLEILPLEFDSWKQRLQLVLNHPNSTLIDAKFTGKGRPDIHSKYMDKKRDISVLLQYKYLLAIEGNDVSSGLKWMLFSNSVVFLPPVTMISWAMEDLLQPFVHYIPIYANLTNIEQMVHWAENNPILVERIAQRSTLFIYDLLFHPDAYRDEEYILETIMRRYENTFGMQ